MYVWFLYMDVAVHYLLACENSKILSPTFSSFYAQWAKSD